MNKKNIVLFALACGVVCQNAGAVMNSVRRGVRRVGEAFDDVWVTAKQKKNFIKNGRRMINHENALEKQVWYNMQWKYVQKNFPTESPYTVLSDPTRRAETIKKMLDEGLSLTLLKSKQRGAASKLYKGKPFSEVFNDTDKMQKVNEEVALRWGIDNDFFGLNAEARMFYAGGIAAGITAAGTQL